LKKGKSNQGFTLIELVIVIIILGILGATAIPKFINLRSDAVLSTMDTLVGVIESADQIVYMKAAIEGVQDESSATITIDGTNIATVYGYIAEQVPLVALLPGFTGQASMAKMQVALCVIYVIDNQRLPVLYPLSI